MHMNTLCGKRTEFLNATAGGRHTNQGVLKG